MTKKLTRGGKLSIGVAVIWAFSFVWVWMIIPFSIPDILSPFFIHPLNVFYTPLYIFGISPFSGWPSMRSWMVDFVLMVPNCFLWGYSLSFCCRVFKFWRH